MPKVNERTTSHTHSRRQGITSAQVSPDWITRLTGRVTINGTGCWIVGGNPNAYGKASVGGKQEPTHRVVYDLINGPLDPSDHVHHTCLTPACINPEHLVAMSAGDHQREHARLRRAS